MPKKMSKMTLTEQPLRWGRAIFCGMISAIFMMAFIDTYYLMGLTPFSFELYLGSLIRGTQYGDHNWTVGFLANLVLGGLFGILYGYLFEYVFDRATSRLGIWLGVWHTIAATIAFFPFFGEMHEYIGTGLYLHFGILGSSLSASTPVLLVTGHLLFGASMGLFYGGVRTEGVWEREYEPGVSGRPGDEDVITPEEDPRDRFVYYPP